MTRKWTGWGWGWEEETSENTKEGRRAIAGSNSTLLKLQRGPLSVSGPLGKQQEGEEETAAPSPGCPHWHQLPAGGKTGCSGCRRERPGAFFLFSEELEKTEPSLVNQARSSFLPQGTGFPGLGKHTWLAHSHAVARSSSFLPGGWSLGEIKCLAEAIHFEVKNHNREEKLALNGSGFAPSQ